MAYYFGINRGDSKDKALVSGSTTSKDIEIVVNQTNVTDKQALKVGLESLIDFVTTQLYPPV